MRASVVGLIARRELLTRVRSRSFRLGTAVIAAHPEFAEVLDRHGLTLDPVSGEVVELEASADEAARFERDAPGVRASLRVESRSMLFADDAAAVAEWLRAHDGGDRRPLVVRPANLEDVFLRVTGTTLEADAE